MWQRSFDNDPQSWSDHLNGDGCSAFESLSSSISQQHQWMSGMPVFAPEAWAPTYDYPLICFLHDDDRSEQDLWEWFPAISDQNFLALGVRAPFPAQTALPGQYRWRGQRPDATAAALIESIERVREEWNVHQDRIVLFGEGNGAVAALQQFLLNQMDRETSEVRYSSVICRNLPLWWTRALPPVTDFASGRILLLNPGMNDEGEIPAAIDGLNESGISVTIADEGTQSAGSIINNWIMSGIATSVF